VENALSVFYRHLHIENMICDISIFFGESQLAHVWCQECGFKMTREVSECVHDPCQGLIPLNELSHHHVVPCTYVNWTQNRDPNNASEGVIQGLGGATHELVSGLTDTIIEPINALLKGNGLSGAVEGVVHGLRGFIISPIAGGQILLGKVSEGFKNSLGPPSLPDPNRRFTRDGSIRRPDGSVYGDPFQSSEIHASPKLAVVDAPSTLSRSNLSRVSLEHSIPLEMSCVFSSPINSESIAETKASSQSLAAPSLNQIAGRRESPSLLSNEMRIDSPESFSSTASSQAGEVPWMNFHAAVIAEEEHNQQSNEEEDGQDGDDTQEGDGSEQSHGYGDEEVKEDPQSLHQEVLSEYSEDSEQQSQLLESHADLSAIFTQFNLNNVGEMMSPAPYSSTSSPLLPTEDDNPSHTESPSPQQLLSQDDDLNSPSKGSPLSPLSSFRCTNLRKRNGKREALLARSCGTLDWFNDYPTLSSPPLNELALEEVDSSRGDSEEEELDFDIDSDLPRGTSPRLKSPNRQEEIKRGFLQAKHIKASLLELMGSSSRFISMEDFANFFLQTLDETSEETGDASTKPRLDIVHTLLKVHIAPLSLSLDLSLMPLSLSLSLSVRICPGRSHFLTLLISA
jgi:hypothetical protein